MWVAPNNQESFEFLITLDIGNITSNFNGIVYQTTTTKDYNINLEQSIINAKIALDNNSKVDSLMKCIYDLSIALKEYETNK